MIPVPPSATTHSIRTVHLIERITTAYDRFLLFQAVLPLIPTALLLYTLHRESALAEYLALIGLLSAQALSAGYLWRLRRTKQTLREAEEERDQFFNLTSDLLCVCGPDGYLKRVNPAFERTFGFSTDELMSRPAYEFIHPDDRNGVRQELEKLFEEKQTVYYECRRLCKDGSYRWIAWTCPPPLPGNNLVYATGHDITDRKQGEMLVMEQILRINALNADLANQKEELEAVNTRLETLAHTDGLTGLRNHRAFQERLKTEFRRAMRQSTPLSLLILDVDEFKKYNDAYGHLAGDDVLKSIARLLRKNARDTDLVARYGGEEFTIVLPNTDAMGAVAIAERLRAIIETASWKERLVTVSFGVSTLTPATADRAALIADADRALYHSKQHGRNCVTHAHDLPWSKSDEIVVASRPDATTHPQLPHPSLLNASR